jgi:hypothetical protein
MEGNAGTQVENEVVVTSLTKNVIDIQDYDVLLGRGKLYQKHVGNLNLRGTLEQSSVNVPGNKGFWHSPACFTQHSPRSREHGALLSSKETGWKVQYISGNCEFYTWFLSRSVFETRPSLLGSRGLVRSAGKGGTGNTIPAPETMENWKRTVKVKKALLPTSQRLRAFCYQLYREYEQMIVGGPFETITIEPRTTTGIWYSNHHIIIPYVAFTYLIFYTTPTKRS